ncbi:MAG: hypothetical protein LBQ48_01265 [Oscillospiraceae bacterium]|nr:hypothetical protein [Oscillospiraceae bacterium]
MSKLKSYIPALCVAALFLSSCVPAGSAAPEAPAGFWEGLFHGALAPLTLILGLLFKSIVMYEPNNSGGGYNFGFVAALCAEILIVKYLLANHRGKL